LAKEFQTILGFGGAFTDSACINILSLNVSLRERLLNDYFGPDGLQYTLGRVPIGGSDFSTRPYSYDDTDSPDLELSHWALTSEDLDYKIPVIMRAKDLTEYRNESLKLIASPWSPPKWMKQSNSFKRGHLINSDEIYKAYAQYLVNFYQAYESFGLRFWGATVQNEPVAANIPFYYFNSMQMSAGEAIRLVRDHLGPALEGIGYNKTNFKLLVGDDSLLFVDQHVLSVLADEKVRNYISGMAFHWYSSGLIAPYSQLSKLTQSLKGKIDYVVMTEACAGAMPFSKHVDVGNWDRGESYSMDIIEDMSRNTNAWLDWNLALDVTGGPNWAGNFVDSPIIVNKAANIYYKQPMYYHMGHFSRFFRPNSVRVEANLEHRYFFEKIMLLAVHNKQTGHLVVNILNRSPSSRKLKLEVRSSSVKVPPFEVEGRSISTVIVKL